MKELIYGYTRVSTKKQSIERQVRNILGSYPNAIIIKEFYSGINITNRKELNKLIDTAKKENSKGNKVTIVFDEVSRMSRNEIEGFSLYQELFNIGVNLVFLKEQHINTEIYNNALNTNISLTGTNADIILKAVKEYLMELAKEQIKIAFRQSEKEVLYLHKRTSEGIKIAQLNGKQVGRIKGNKYVTKKEKICKEIIINKSNAFNGNNTDEELMKICNISRNTFYKYKNEIKHSYF